MLSVPSAARSVFMSFSVAFTEPTFRRVIPPDEPVLVPMDDRVPHRVAQHRGKCVYGKGCHHDAVRSARKHVVFRWGHRWIVLAISLKFPFTWRRWALPVLAALYRPEPLNQSENRRHRVPSGRPLTWPDN